MTVKAITSVSAQRIVGDIWPIGVEIFDDVYGVPVATAPTVTITLPDNSTATAIAVAVGHCYLARYELTVPGRHIAAAMTDSAGRADFAIQAVEATPAGRMPQLADATTYLGAHSWSDNDVQGALDAETDAQRTVCAIPAYYPNDLRDALLRRVQRNLSMRRLPLAVLQGDAEAGSSTLLPSWDPEISRLERPHLRLLVA